MAVILNLAASQPPSTITIGNWPVGMRTGKWFFSFTPSFASNALPVATPELWDFAGTAGNETWLQNMGGGVCDLFVISGGNLVLQRTISFSASQKIGVLFDLPGGKITITGATTGNGTANSLIGAWTWPNGSLGVGDYLATPGSEFSGSFDNVEDGDASSASTQPGLTAAAVGTLAVDGTVAATMAGPPFLYHLDSSGSGTITVSGTSAISLPGLDASGTGVDATEGAVIAQVEGLSAASAGDVSYSGTSASTQPGLSASAAGSFEVTGTCAADMAALECSGTAVAVSAAASLAVGAIEASGVGITGISADSTADIAGLAVASSGTVSMTGDAALELAGLLSGGVADAGQITIPTGGQFVSSGGTVRRTVALFGSPDAGAFVPPAHGTLQVTAPVLQWAGAPPAGAFVSHRSNWPAALPSGSAAISMPALSLAAVAPLSISGSAAMTLELLNISAGSSGGVVTGTAAMSIGLTCAAFGGATLLTDRAGLPLTDRSGAQLTSRS